MDTMGSRMLKLTKHADMLKAACETGDPKLIEQAIGSIYAVAGRMAEDQQISWTAVCDCACEKHTGETNEEKDQEG